MASTFQIDPSDYLSIDYEAFRDDMLQLALSKPAEYFELRKAVLMAVKKEACVQQYSVYYNLLTKAKKSDGATSIFQGMPEPTASNKFVPNYPKQLVNQFALGAAKTIDKISEDAVELLLPRDFKSIANERTGTKSKGLGIE